MLLLIRVSARHSVLGYRVVDCFERKSVLRLPLKWFRNLLFWNRRFPFSCDNRNGGISRSFDRPNEIRSSWNENFEVGTQVEKFFEFFLAARREAHIIIDKIHRGDSEP